MIKTGSKVSPKPQVNVVPSRDVNITFLISQLDESASHLTFSIRREDKDCRTPRRNNQINAAFMQFGELRNWCMGVSGYFNGQLFPVQTEPRLHMGAVDATSLFVPVLPLFEEAHKHSKSETASSSSSSASLVALPDTAQVADSAVILPVGDVNAFLAEQKRSFSEKFAEISKIFPESSKLISVPEVRLVVLSLHSAQISQAWADGIDYIEQMLRNQLVAALGKEVGPVDFNNYMRYHYRKLFKTQYEPRPFCYAIRRPDHYPEVRRLLHKRL